MAWYFASGETGELKHFFLPFWAAGAWRDLVGNLVGLQVFGHVWREASDCPLRTMVISSGKSSWHLLSPKPLSPSGHSFLVTLEQARGNWVSSTGMPLDHLTKVVITTTAANAEARQSRKRGEKERVPPCCALFSCS